MATKKKELYSVRNVQVLNMRDLRKIYSHARQMGWIMGNYGTKIKKLEEVTAAIQKEFKRRGKALPY